MKRRRFKQLTRTDRLNIEKYLRQGMTKQAVADALASAFERYIMN